MLKSKRELTKSSFATIAKLKMIITQECVLSNVPFGMVTEISALRKIRRGVLCALSVMLLGIEKSIIGKQRSRSMIKRALTPSEKREEVILKLLRKVSHHQKVLPSKSRHRSSSSRRKSAGAHMEPNVDRL